MKAKALFVAVLGLVLVAALFVLLFASLSLFMAAWQPAEKPESVLWSANYLCKYILPGGGRCYGVGTVAVVRESESKDSCPTWIDLPLENAKYTGSFQIIEGTCSVYPSAFQPEIGATPTVSMHATITPAIKKPGGLETPTVAKVELTPIAPPKMGGFPHRGCLQR